MYRLTCSILAQAPVTDVFRVFEDPRNLSKITPASLHFRILDPDVIKMRKGAEIDYEIRWLGAPMHWKTVIVEYTPPTLFIDEQARGPYHIWRHQHAFAETSEGVKISDLVDYSLPLGLLGRLAHAAVVKKQLLGIFRYRQREIAKLLGVPVTSCEEPAITYL